MKPQADTEKALLSGYEASSGLEEQAAASPQSPLGSPHSARRWIAAGLLSIGGLALIFGGVSKLPMPSCMHSMHSSSSGLYNATGDSSIDPGQVFLSIPSTDRLRENLKYYTSGTHVAGINRTQAVYTRDYFQAQGINAEIVEYYPWLNYPVSQRVALFNESTQEVVFEAGLKEDVIPGDPASDDPNNLPAFHGYSADGNLQKLGWRPRRSIILASWDAEEYSLIGSTEWVEENIDWLRANAVAYVNVDGAVGGSQFAVGASPLFKDLLHEVTKQVPYPNSNETVYDTWLRNSINFPMGASVTTMKDGAMNVVSAKGKMLRLKPNKKGKKKGKKTLPTVYPLGSGSDFTAFMAHAGISSIDMGFGGKYGSYHSNYDSFKWMSSFVDPDFKLHQAMSRIWGLLTIRLADDPVLSLNPVSYAKDMKVYIKQLEEHVSSQLDNAKQHKDKDIDAIIAKKFRHLRASQRQLLVNAHLVELDKRHLRTVYGEDCQMTGKRRLASCHKLRKSINDRVSRLERHFIDPEGIPGREWYKHVLVSPGRWMGYGSQTFPALAEASEDHEWKKFQQYEKRTAEIIYEAAWFLREV
ncbi:Zn-dependent exopeptidase [Martensiomyces pterosporus]|nr:Zn-dependent exopeptidase [Martensiomyces pterosporus]